MSSSTNINDRDDDGWTVLHHAVFKRDFSEVRLLLKAGADVNAKSSHYRDGKTYFTTGTTPLHIASRIGDVAVFWLLIDNGADINAQDHIQYVILLVFLFLFLFLCCLITFSIELVGDPYIRRR